MGNGNARRNLLFDCNRPLTIKQFYSLKYLCDKKCVSGRVNNLFNCFKRGRYRHMHTLKYAPAFNFALLSILVTLFCCERSMCFYCSSSKHAILSSYRRATCAKGTTKKSPIHSSFFVSLFIYFLLYKSLKSV